MATAQTLSSMLVLVKVLTFLVCVKETVSGIAVRKFMYQKDMSEHCRRRVVPSVFLGRHVADAYSQILHFSKLELPYSCSISVRTESGSNIILVVQLLSDDSLIHSCSKNTDQLLVYEMGETFGGYWGPLPDTFMNPEPAEVKLYTLKTTQMIVTKPRTAETTSETPVDTTTQEVNIKGNDEGLEYYTVEIPLVNVSGELIPGDPTMQKASDVDDDFDIIFDVTPRLGDQYETSILPLVQFAIEKQKNGRRNEEHDSLPRFQLHSDVFTPDSRLIYPRLNTGATRGRYPSKYKYNINRRLKFNKNKTSFNKIKNRLKFANRMDATKRPTNKYINIENRVHTVPYSTEVRLANITNSHRLGNQFLQQKEDLLTAHHNLDTKENSGSLSNNISSFISEILNRKYNYSAYLYPKLDFTKDFFRVNNNINKNTVSSRASFNRRKTMDYSRNNISQLINTNTILSTKPISTTEMQALNVTIEKTETFRQLPSQNLSTTGLKIIEVFNETNIVTVTEDSYKNNKENIEKKNTTLLESSKLEINLDIITTYKVSESPQTGSMVDHESWENVVKAAPVMAVHLNQTVADEGVYGQRSSDKKVRKERHIKAIAIEEARPHKLTTTRESDNRTAVTQYQISDVQDFAQLVELLDDQLHDRVALRYVRHYVGRTLFNICDYHEPKTRHVYLFNSSRIVIALKNFTMDRMTVVMTPARAVLSGEMSCSEAHLECQVSGTRVCIDSMSACDGVPNCGAYDIYDEDRLMCGAAVGLQHSVFLAAVTFLAVMLTMLYTVHYWLQRCVPKVSDAFFIYSDGDDNKLILDSIMRSPNEIDEIPKMMYADVFDEDLIYHDSKNKRRRYIVCNWLRKYLTFECFRKSSKKMINIDNVLGDRNVYSERKFSFTELELSKMAHVELTNTSVQTGDSLEVTYLEGLKKKDNNRLVTNTVPRVEPNKNERRKSKSNTTQSITYERKHSDELNMLKLFKGARSESLRSTQDNIRSPVDRRRAAIVEEREIKSHLYDNVSSQGVSGITNIITTSDIHPETKSTKPVIKRLRFDEEITTIPSEDFEQKPDDNVIGGYNESNISQTIDTITEAEEHASTSRDFKRFWGNKGKKSKKKAHLHVR